MRFGYCTGFAAGMSGPVNYALLEQIEAAGYDFAELPLMQLAALDTPAFSELVRRAASLRIAFDACCNMFPSHVRLLGEEASLPAITAYLEVAFERMCALNVRKVVLGSSGARRLPEGMDAAEGFCRLSALIAQNIVPFLERSNMLLVIEPIGSYEANFIHTLPEGMEIVRQVNHPRVQLLADSVHMLYEREPPQHVTDCAPHLRHIHLCESGRMLPSQMPTPQLRAILSAIRHSGYDGTISFEPLPHTPKQMHDSLAAVRMALNLPRNA